MSPQHETQRMKRQQALAVGRIDTASTLTDTLISIVNAIRDQGAPEDTFEHLTQALTGLNQTRRALAAASRSLYRHSEEQPMSRREARGRLDRLAPTMRELLIALFNHTMLPATSNNSRTFAALEERGLIQPDFYDNWALTDEGHKTALDLLKRR